MALIVRVDVDRPYGKHPAVRHVFSRLSSDVAFPAIRALGYLRELKAMLRVLNETKAPAYVFFRRCTLPSPEVLELLEVGGHEIGMHLENSRTFESFEAERQFLEGRVGRKIRCFSKHGSGGQKYGRRHYAPYEPDKYVAWGQRAGMKVFLGNLQDPTIRPFEKAGLITFPAAFWLEPCWRNTQVFTTNWLLAQAATLDVVLLVHPENVLESFDLVGQFRTLISCLETRILP